jgi:hypothetical protein
MKNKLMGAITTAAALAFVTAPVTSVVAHAGHKVACYGVNACKGKSACKTATSACKGQNSCKSKGAVMTSAKNCKKLGGTTKAPAN